MNHFLTVGTQVLVLFLLMLVGYFCNKGKILSKEGNKRISDLVVIVVTPCVIIKSFQREFNPEMMKLLLVALLVAVVSHIVMILLAGLCIRNPDEKRNRVLRFGTVFSNAGFIALPLQEALLGASGVFFGAAYLVVFNIFLWSWGIYHMSGDKSTITPKKILLSPGIIGVAIGMLIFLTSYQLPEVISVTIGHVAALNVPLPMMVVGYYLAETNMIEALKDGSCYLCMLLRLILFPLLGMGIMYLIGVPKDILVTMVISLSAPVGATTTMFSEKFDLDTSRSVQLVSVTTLLSMLTMPLIVGLAQTIL